MRARVVPVHHGSYETYVTGRSIGASTSHTSTPETGNSDPSTVHNHKEPNHSKKLTIGGYKIRKEITKGKHW